MDWTIGVGNTFWAGELSGRFVIGVEDREKFFDVASGALVEVLKREPKAKEIVATQDKLPKAKEVTLDDDDLYDFGGFGTSG